MIAKLLVIFYLLSCLLIYSIFAELVGQDEDVKKDSMERIMNFAMFIVALLWPIAFLLNFVINKIKGESV